MKFRNLSRNNIRQEKGIVRSLKMYNNGYAIYNSPEISSNPPVIRRLNNSFFAAP